MAEITAAMVKELREKTDAPMMECKKALAEASGDLGKAEEILRVKLGSKAAKASSRVAAEGIVAVSVSADGKLVATWGKQGLGPGEFDWVHGIVVDSKGAVYAADTYGQRIQKFVPGGSSSSR